MNLEVSLDITEDALKELKSATEQSEIKDVLVRISVKGGGCSGYIYGLEFVERKEINLDQDITEKKGDIEIVVDKKSLLFLDGVKIDWISDLSQRGFKFINPNAKRTCGCGKSFQ